MTFVHLGLGCVIQDGYCEFIHSRVNFISFSLQVNNSLWCICTMFSSSIQQSTNEQRWESSSVVRFSLREYAPGWYCWDHSFLRSLYTDIHSGYASLPSYQQWTVFLSLCPCHNLLAFFFLVLPMLTGVGWSHREIFICISLMEFK